MRVLVTGAAGFLGRGLIVPFEERGYRLRLMDVTFFESRHEVVVGSVADLDACTKAAAGMEAIVIAHMAPRTPGAYDSPTAGFDVNVKGTANLFHAAVQHGIKAVVVISSTSVFERHKQGPHPHDLPLQPLSYYGLSKACQELIAETFARQHGIRVACLRCGYILDGDANVDKYGHVVTERNPPCTDRRDIGEVARLCLERPEIGYETFTVMSAEESLTLWDVRYTCERLGWKPKYDFRWLRTPKPKEPA
jgi:nucleoside-diphosphate-sugar epimerase